MKVLGIDLGAKRVGVALGDTVTRVATPLTVIARGPTPGSYRRSVAELVAEWEVGAVVVGLPVDLRGAKGPAAVAAEAEAAQLREALPVPVALYDERLTTAAAQRSLREQGIGSRGQKGKIDAVAAAVLLQSWLEAVAAGTAAAPQPSAPGDP